MAQLLTTRNCDAGSSGSSQPVDRPRTIVSYNMHGFNQGSSTVRDLSLSTETDIFLLQEHWLTPANLYKLEEYFPQYLCIGTSAMRSSVESGVLYGRPFGGVSILVSKKLLHCTEIVCCSDRFVVIGVSRSLIINVYLPCIGTTDRLCVIEEILCELEDYINKYNDRFIIIGGDLNTDLDKVNPASDLINRFVAINGLYRCDKSRNGADKCQSDARYTYYSDSQGVQSTLDFLLTNDASAVLSFAVMDRVMNLSDHTPIAIQCRSDNLTSLHDCSSQGRCGSRIRSATGDQSVVRNLRWDHADLARYRAVTGFYLQSVFDDLTAIDKSGSINIVELDSVYKKIVDVLKYSSDITVPSRPKNFFKFWWDQSLDELKTKSIASCDLWKTAGRPRAGPVFDRYRRDKAAYRYAIRSKQAETKEVYSNQLHEALLAKQGPAFWKCWGSKFETRRRAVNSVNGLTNPEGIVDLFVSYFSKACSSNSAAGALRLRQTYEKMRASYMGQDSDNTHRFDAELVENVICNKMRLGKAADLDGITVEHLFYCHSLLPCILAKLFNLMMDVGHIPRSFGLSYTVPVLKNSNSIYCKSVTVDDFRGISISPVLSKVFEHCILDRFGDFFTSCDNQFGFKKRHSCTHAIYSLKAVIDYYVSHDSTVNLCTIDLSKAFDRMNHYGLFVRLMQRRIPSKLLYILEQWFISGSTCVKWGSFVSEFFDLRSGVRQGGVLSPYLFAVYIDNVFECVSDSGLGCSFKRYCMSIFMYADDLILLAPSVSALQRLLHVCEYQLEWLDMSINVNKSACIRIGPRHKVTCYNLVTLDGREIQWTNTVRYLGVYLVSAKMFTCAIDNAKKSFYRSFNCIFGKVGRVASEHVVVELLKTKCIPVLLYGLEVCSLSKTQIRSLDYAILSCYRKLFNVKSSENVRFCMSMFNCDDVDTLLTKRKQKFIGNLALMDNLLCELIAVLSN